MEEFMLCIAYTVKSGYREDFIREVQQSGVLDVIRREDGCLTYEYYCSAAKEDQVLLIEKWATEKQQKTHLDQPHMELLKRIKNKYVTDTSLEKYFPVR